jgi:hypothetical protein
MTAEDITKLNELIQKLEISGASDPLSWAMSEITE